MNSSLYQKRSLRLLVGIGLPIAALSLAAFCLISGKTPPCLFYELTGLYCPGCGTGRALLALLHGRLYAAFRYQPLMIICLPVLVYYIAKLYLAFLFGRDILPFPTIRNKWLAITVTSVIIAYWILRNIPVIPFSYLAPTSL